MIDIESAYRQQEEYRGNEETRQSIKNTTLLAFVGGVAVGKNYLMEASGFPVSGTITTRVPRVGDGDKYTYASHDEMLEAIELGELVQYGIATAEGKPTEIYGSKPSDYSLDLINVSDIWADAVYPLYNKGFKVIRTVGVLTPKDQWLSQLNDRLTGQAAPKVIARLEEARHSIRWALAQHLSENSTHLTVINDAAGNIASHNVDRIISSAQNNTVEPIDNDTVQTTAKDMLDAIETFYSRIKIY